MAALSQPKIKRLFHDTCLCAEAVSTRIEHRVDNPPSLQLPYFHFTYYLLLLLSRKIKNKNQNWGRWHPNNLSESTEYISSHPFDTSNFDTSRLTARLSFLSALLLPRPSKFSNQKLQLQHLFSKTVFLPSTDPIPLSWLDRSTLLTSPPPYLRPTTLFITFESHHSSPLSHIPIIPIKFSSSHHPRQQPPPTLPSQVPKSPPRFR